MSSENEIAPETALGNPFNGSAKGAGEVMHSRISQNMIWNIVC